MVQEVKHSVFTIQALTNSIENKFKQKKWDSLRNFLDKATIKQYATDSQRTSGKSLLFLCYQSNDTPLDLIYLISDVYLEQENVLSNKSSLNSNLDLYTAFHEGINNHVSLVRLKHLLEVNMRLENSISIIKICGRGKGYPLYTFLEHFSFYSAEKEQALEFTSILIDLYPGAVHYQDIYERTPLTLLILQMDSSNQNNQDNEDIFIDVIKLVVSVYDSHPQWKHDFISVIHSSLAITSPRRLELLDILIKVYPPTYTDLAPLCVFVEMEVGEDELKWLVENSSDAVIAQDHCYAINLLWINFLKKWHSLQTILQGWRYSLLSNYHNPCLESTKQAIQEYQMTKEETRLYDFFKRFWSKVYIILGSPALMIHKLCTIPCTKALTEIAILLHPEQLSRCNKDNQLPLHVAMSDNKYSNLFCTVEHDADVSITKAELLFQLYPEALREKDGVMNIYPFMIAAKNSNLNLCYQMLRMIPEVVMYGFQNEN